MSDEIKLTARQAECLVNIYLKDHSWEGRRSTKTDGLMPAPEGGFPAWGAPDRYRHVSRMGGALKRLRDGMADAELLFSHYSERGYRSIRDEITSKGLKALKALYPALPDIDWRIEQVVAFEEAQAKADEAKAAENRRQLDATRERRRAARAERMNAILQDYQINHSLTPDQLHDMWVRVCDEEHQL